MNGAQILLLSHITKVFSTFSVKLQLQWRKSIILSVITRLSTPPNLIKLLVRHEWTQMNTWKRSIKKQGVFTANKKDSELETKSVLSFLNVWQKKESLSVMENLLKIFDNIHRICMPGQKKNNNNFWLSKLAFSALLSYAGQMIFQMILKKFENKIEIVWSFQSGFGWEHWHKWHSPTCHFHQSCYCWLWYCWRVFRYGEPFLHNHMPG